ncbi:hypothetical protein HUN43_00044 [Streptomyces phage Endor1]|uniref:Uncharacterized protein n=1 Tax=Streptomyces phage Endor1 TaxID=2740181 RepID=A0A7G4AWY8_9CAUD|nr:hypothetical protein KGG92_gp44 [Streptomyces phage Endor1]QMP84528.1 hypothetical protein HUN43_00044 [Streptomyces phage Endor1]
MSETTPEVPVEEPVTEPVPEQPVHEPVTPPADMAEHMIEFWDDVALTYYERAADGLVYSRPYTENELARYAKDRQLDALGVEAKAAIGYLDARIDLSLAYLALVAPTPEETAAQVKVLSDLAAYNAGTLKRILFVLGEVVGRPV